MKLRSLSILIPAYKDEDSITAVIKRAMAVGRIAAKKFEIVAINDASPDATGAVLDRLAKKIPELRVIHHPVNRGYGQTIEDLYFEGRNEWLFTVPGDYQIDPMELLKLIPSSGSADMIIGWRKVRNDAPDRKRQSAIYNSLIRLLYGLPLHDINSVRLMKRAVMKGRKIHTTSAFIDAELAIGAIRDGFTVVEVPIIHRARRTAGASGGKPSVILPVIWEMIRFRFSR